MLKFYAHSFCKSNNFSLTDITKLDEILQKGYLLSRRKLGLKEEFALFNGMDYILLCDLEKIHPEYSAYNMYIKNSLSLLFDKNIKTINPTILNLRREIEHGYSILCMGSTMHDYGKKGRYSDLVDEVQIKDELSLEYLRGLSLSLNSIKSNYSEYYINSYLSYIVNILNLHNYDVPLYNLDDEQIIKVKSKVINKK